MRIIWTLTFREKSSSFRSRFALLLSLAAATYMSQQKPGCRLLMLAQSNRRLIAWNVSVAQATCAIKYTDTTADSGGTALQIPARHATVAKDHDYVISQSHCDSNLCSLHQQIGGSSNLPKFSGHSKIRPPIESVHSKHLHPVEFDIIMACKCNRAIVSRNPLHWHLSLATVHYINTMGLDYTPKLLKTHPNKRF